MPPCNSISLSPVLLYLFFSRFPSPLLSRLLGVFIPSTFFSGVPCFLAFPFSCFGCSCLNLGFLLRLNFVAGVEVGVSPWAVRVVLLHHGLCLWSARQRITGRYFPGKDVRIQLQSIRLALKPCVSMAFQGPWVTLPVLLPSNVSLERTRDSINPD